MEYESLSRCLGGEMVDTRDSKSRAKERGGSSPLQGIILELEWQRITKSWSSSLSNERGVHFEIVRPAPTPRVYASTGIAQGEIDTIETSGTGKMPARNVTPQRNYIVRFRDWRLTHLVTLALYVPKMGTIGSDEFNNRHLLAFQPSLYFQGLSERESSTSWS